MNDRDKTIHELTRLVHWACTQHQLDLSKSWAYSDSFSDYPMLAAVGHPTATNPDARLRAIARSYDWPTLDLR